MYQINDDNSIYVTRGDIVEFTVSAEDKVTKEPIIFQPGDLVRIKVFGKKNCENVVLQKDFAVGAAAERVEIFLDEKDTKIGEVINKPTDYWYEVELNPLSDPQTIVGYNEDGPVLFRLFPEGRDLDENDPVITPEDIPLVDDALDLTSERPIKNKAVARAVIRIHAAIEDVWKNASNTKGELDILKARMDEFTHLPNSSTAGDAELADARIGFDRVAHSNAGNAIREQISVLYDREEQSGGVYAMPLKYTTAGTRFESNIFKVPKGGMSLRITEEMETKISGVSCRIFGKVQLGRMEDGSFVYDEALTAEYTYTSYTNRTHYIPYIEGAYAKIHVIYLGNNDTRLTADNINDYWYITNYAKVYTGIPNKSGGLLGASVATLVTSGDEEKYNPDWSFRTLSHKYQSMVSPLPLKYVRKVSCPPDVWLGAKIYKFDPITRETSFVETLNFCQNNPCYGTECVIDFEKYEDNYFALLCFGKTPKWKDYNTLGYNGSTTATRGNTCVGFDMSDLVGSISVEWLPNSVKSDSCGGSPIVQRNIELLKMNKHKTIPALYVNGNGTAYSYILGKDDFAGVFYGGGYPGGMFYYNVSPATYYAALLNPNSNAYKQDDNDIAKHGFRYGIMCSTFTMLAHGHPIPRSTFDLRYNNDVEGFELKPMNLLADLHKLKPYDVITQGAGQTGHSVLVSGMDNIGDTITALKIMEAATPAIRDNVFFLHNGAPYYKENAEEWYQEAYDFMAISDPAYDVSLHDKANWIAPYTEPQKVMCNRGYGAVYIKGKTKVVLSVHADVTSITIDIDESFIGEYAVSSFSPTQKNGYNIVDITDLVDAGTVKVSNNLNSEVEEFYILDVEDYNITLDTTEAAANKVKVTVSHPDEVKYLEANYLCTEGKYAGKSAPLFFSPKFEGNVMTIPNKFETDIGVWEFSAYPDPRDYLNVIFKTNYDTNTFGVDAENDKYV